jgi:hypothetical protein
MSATIAEIVKQLEQLPVPEQEAAARYVRDLAAGRRERRVAMLRETAGSLSGAEGAALEEAIAHCSA